MDVFAVMGIGGIGEQTDRSEPSPGTSQLSGRRRPADITLRCDGPPPPIRMGRPGGAPNWWVPGLTRARHIGTG
ncbi:hypothetical protein ACIGBH_24510 [Streptomyces sp. NPDC085929]|uniref:hypothetical protein n=1 Tax=Streptomyces sp. NPDC085929 TaxID=3365739 RepID=UPI0037D111F4